MSETFEERYDENLDPRPVREWEDRAPWAVKTVVWSCYDDMSTHRLEGSRALSPGERDLFARMILFLQGDRAYEWARYDFMFFHATWLDRLTFGWWGRRQEKNFRSVDWAAWPFRRVEDFEAARRGE